MKRNLLICLFISLCVLQLQAQELTIEQAVMNTGLRPARQQMIWGGPAGGYLQVKNSSIVSFQAKSGKESVVLTRDELNGILKSSGIKEVTSIQMPEILPSGDFRFTVGQVLVEIDWKTKKLIGQLSVPPEIADKCIAPSGRMIAYTIGQNVFISDNNGKKITVTSDEENGIVNGQTVSRSEFGIGSGLFWSPNSSMIAFYRKDERQVTEYPLVHVTETPALLEKIRYPMAGATSETITVGIYNISEASTIFLDEQAFGYDRYMTNITWDPTGNYVYVSVLNREQNHLLLNQYDTKTGKKIKTLFEETSDKYVEPSNGLVFNPADPSQFIFFSQRDGFKHLYLYRTDGSLIKQLTRGDWMVTSLLRWDQSGRYIFFTATDPSPLERQVYRLDVKTGSRIKLTPDSGTHDVQISQDCHYLIDSYSSYSVPRRILIYDIGKGESRTVYDAPNPLAGRKMGEYKPFTIKAADKKTDLYGYLVLPPDLDPAKKYPVIVYVYGGPHAQMVVNQWMGGASGWQYYMAQLGYISMTLDNRGSDFRGRDFEQVIHRNLGKAEMADQMEGINYLYTLPFVDANRIGVHGWSFGGFMTTSLMLNYPDVYKVGVAGGPVIDWKYYEVMYGERYMDTPAENPEGFALSSTLPKVQNLSGRLMLIHGDNDPVVVWQNSLMFLRKCISEGKLVDYMVYPQHPHNVGGKDRIHLMRTVTRYFQDNL